MASVQGGGKKRKKALTAKELVQKAKARRKQRAAKRERDRGTLQRLESAILAILPQVGGNKLPPQDKPSTMATAFPRFKELPAEIRVPIWELSLPDARIFEPVTTRHGDDYEFWRCRLHHKHAPPTIRAVCKEAWEVTEKNGRFLFGTISDSRMNGCWFNPSLDILYLSPKPGYLAEHQAAHGGDIACPEDLEYTSILSDHYDFEYFGISMPRHAAFRWQFLLGDHDHVWYFLFSGDFETLAVVYEDDEVKKPWSMVPKAYRLEDSDEFNGTLNGSILYRGWGEVRREITQMFDTWANKNYDAETLRAWAPWPPFKIEGLQIIRQPIARESTLPRCNI